MEIFVDKFDLIIFQIIWSQIPNIIIQNPIFEAINELGWVGFNVRQC